MQGLLSQLEEWLIEITETLAAHNQPTPTSPQRPLRLTKLFTKAMTGLEHDMALCVKYKVPIIITSLGAREDIKPSRSQLMVAWFCTTSSTTSLRTRPLKKAQMV
jgi:NAD(P)H-dependent flavin oxidoreductase YrpB (nitropropane dioxygenase family)